MSKIQSNFKKVLLFLIYVLALFPILPRGIESVLMIVIFIVSAFYYFKFNTSRITKKQLLTVLTFSILFFVYLFSLLYSSDLKSGLNYVIKVIPLALFPLIFGIFIPNLLSSKEVKTIFNIYVLSIFFGLVFIQCSLFLNINTNAINNWDYRNAFEALTDVHGTYFSIWIGFGLFVAFSRLLSSIKKQNYIKLSIWAFIITYLVYWQLKLGARFPQLLTIILISIFFFIKVKKRKHKLMGGLTLIIFISIIFTLKPNFVDRLERLANYDFSLPNGDYNYDFDTITNEQIRNGIYLCSSKLIKKSWLTGYGIGDVEEQLQNCYNMELDSNVYNMFNYNSHNQYLHILLVAGVFGLFIFLISLCLPIYLAYKYDNFLYLFFSLFILLSLLTENVLSRHDGILFYSFFNAIFAFTTNKLSKT